MILLVGKKLKNGWGLMSRDSYVQKGGAYNQGGEGCNWNKISQTDGPITEGGL